MPSPSAADFEKVTLDDDTQNPFELDIAPDGRVFYIERNGQVRVWKPTTETTVEIGTIPVTTSQENGLLGIQLAPDFTTSGHIYLAYSALPDSSNQNRLSRFTVVGDQIQPGSEQFIYTWQHQREECCHTGGSLAFGLDGSLYISTGDNSNPFESSGFTPIDERPGREAWDAQRTAANSNNPNGKILRIVPLAGATGVPGIGTTYAIPAGNMFDEAADTQNQTLPEIYAMGFRNPFRITVDPKTGWLLLGDYGPDAGSTNPNRGPQGSVEFNVVDQPGFYGWPYCVRDNVPYNDFNFATGVVGSQVQLREPGQQLAQQHRPDQPAAGSAGRRPGTATPSVTRASRTSAPAARRPAARATTTTRPTRAPPSSPSSTTASGSSASGTRAGSRPRR